MARSASKAAPRLLLVALFAASLLAQALHGPVGGCQQGVAGTSLCAVPHAHDHEHGTHSHAEHAHHGHAHHHEHARADHSTPTERCPEGDDCVVCKVMAQATDPAVATVILCDSSLIEELGSLSTAEPARPFRSGCLARGPPSVA